MNTIIKRGVSIYSQQRKGIKIKRRLEVNPDVFLFKLIILTKNMMLFLFRLMAFCTSPIQIILYLTSGAAVAIGRFIFCFKGANGSHNNINNSNENDRQCNNILCHNLTCFLNKNTAYLISGKCH